MGQGIEECDVEECSQRVSVLGKVVELAAKLPPT
jgi:hypothetical protein